ncbi:Synaptic vesicle transporter SVOP and related transporters (major facilitator superfamily) [Handroanthus impetiginosus]|uniref:Synaptic vesicle transporter SVOP and related transporters (Major facilitator superfamily) n=1 Tax=Handroanthus impetiginosus TaxID=429701 RepID=A0A2G9GA75_9LAMI|nr:Synaptic vesicle transporter SVOP and related transporters (major facilitator superfamily) [Handroanthus impetiginosus]
MTDPNALLSETSPAHPNTLPPLTAEKHHHHSLNETIEHCIGDFGWKQIFQATLVSFAWFFDAQQTFISVFTDAEPKWSCNNNSSCHSFNTNLCQLPDGSWSWDFPATTSIISEWSLQCAGSIIKGLPASSFFFGCLVGGFALATLADSTLGRKNMLVLSSLFMSLTGVLTAASTNLWMYTGMRFISGFGRATVGTCALVLSTELVGKKWRENVGIIGFLNFTLGFLSLPVLAFSFQGSSWRLMYLWTCVPSAFYSLSVFFLVRESPRWLFIKGRKEEFAETLRSIAAPSSRGNLTQSFFGRTCNEWEEQSQTTDIFSTAKILLNRGWSCRRLVAVMVVAFGVGMIYYGMPLGLGNLPFDLYLSVALNALSEFPASLIAFLFIGKMDRKGSVLVLALLSGVCSVSCVLVNWKGMQIVLEIVSFFSACTAFDIVLIYALELFPTSVRNSAVSMVRQAMVLGGVLSPVLVAADRKNGLLSYGVFGVTISICGLCVLCLPETRGRILCDTMKEEERRDNEFNGVC